jgi:hypothetical protein
MEINNQVPLSLVSSVAVHETLVCLSFEFKGTYGYQIELDFLEKLVLENIRK